MKDKIEVVVWTSRIFARVGEWSSSILERYTIIVVATSFSRSRRYQVAEDRNKVQDVVVPRRMKFVDDGNRWLTFTYCFSEFWQPSKLRVKNASIG